MPSHCFLEKVSWRIRQAQTDVMAGVVAVIRVLFVTVVNWRPWNWSTELSICPLMPIKTIHGQSALRGKSLAEVLVKEDYHPDDEEAEGRNGC